MNFTESCESVSELSYVICPYLFKRRDESNRRRCICLNFPVS